MAFNSFQTATLSMTLPISCQICLGKVRQPVICANHHVFCCSCMDVWLKKAGQCPTCRVPITAETPCREILGGTNESDHNDSPATRKCLRKTRGELLLREYEGEIDALIRENDDLRSKNQSLEAQLKTALDPCSMNTVHTGDTRVDAQVLEEWKNKLRAATDVCDKVKQDMDKLKEANKTLRSQNIDLVQENMRLKAEVASRSPQKFGRYTVAALESKIQQYERDVDHLKRALERSDQYIDDLESRFRKSEKKCPEAQEAAASTSGSGTSGSCVLTQQQKISMMLRSLSDNERALICSNPEAEHRTLPRNPSATFLPSPQQFGKNPKNEDSESASPADFLPATPSSAFRSLTLRSPGLREKKVAFKPAPHLRRLDFEDFPSPEKSSIASENQFSPLDKFPNAPPASGDAEPSKSVFWGGWQRSVSDDPPCSSNETSASTVPADEESNGFPMSSEASMDAAYLDKISELDSMMLEGESSSSRGSQLSIAFSPATDLDNTLVPEAQTNPEVRAKEVPKDEAPPSVEDVRADVSQHAEVKTPSHAEELSFDLLFDALEENSSLGPSPVPLSPAGQGGDHGSASSPSTSFSPSGGDGKAANTTRDRHVFVSQPTKRKSHSPFSTSSPTKLSKLM